MSYFAKINSNSVVEQIIVADNIEWAQTNLGGVWVEIFYENDYRKNHGNIGFIYDPVRDDFISPQPYLSWLLDEETLQWVAPITKPINGHYIWNEELRQWEKIND